MSAGHSGKSGHSLIQADVMMCVKILEIRTFWWPMFPAANIIEDVKPLHTLSKEGIWIAWPLVIVWIVSCGFRFACVYCRLLTSSLIKTFYVSSAETAHLVNK